MPGGGNLVRSERFRKAPRTPRTAHARYYYTRSLVLDSPIRKRPNTPRIRCQSAPKVMDSHSRSASPREPMRPQHRPPSPPASPGAFDNRAYQHDESDPNHNDSFSSNGPQQNGHTKEPNGVSDTKTLEAVNLELINLTPKNGNSKKKDVEVDMNATNPYDEYFVPVNEHRKYMRGEKLYVTADKRGEKGGCKRPLCWTLLGLVVAAIVAIIVLAATGILFSNSPTPLEQYNASVSSARALGGIGHVQDHDHDHSSGHDHNTDQDHSVKTTEHQHGPDVQSDEGHEPTMASEEIGDSSMYVPRTVEGELRVDNEEYTPAFQDPESSEYREFVATFAEGIKRALFDRNSLENGDNEITVEIIQLKKGSVIVTYRVHWKPKGNTEPTEDLLSAYKMATKLEDYLSRNNRMINVYHISEDKPAARPVLDICQINKNGCEHECEFDESTLEFTCTCPHGQILDMANPKRCMSLLETQNEMKPDENAKATEKEAKDVTVLTISTNPVTTKVVPEEEKPATESVHIAKHTFDWKETHHMMPETTTESESDVNFSHIFGHPTEKQEEHTHETNKSNSSEETPVPAPAPKTEPEPKSVLEPTAEPEPATEHEPTAEHEPSVEPEPAAEPEPAPEPEGAAENESAAESEQAGEPHPTVEPEPSAEPQPTVVHAPEPTAEPEPKLGSESEPKSEPEPVPEPRADHEPDSKPESETEPQSEPEPTPKPEPEPEPDTSSTTPSSEQIALNPAYMSQSEQSELSEPHPTSEPEPQPPQTAIPKVASSKSERTVETDFFQTHEHETESASNSVTDVPRPTTPDNKHESAKESERRTDQTDLEKSILYTNEGKFEYKPNEGTETTETTTTRISISEPNLINEPSYEPKPEIISILSAKESNNPSSSKDETTTTETSDWLYHQAQISASSSNHTQTEFEELLNSNVNKIMHESEPRSFKTFDVDFMFESTTTMKSTNDDSFDSITKNSVTTEITTKKEEETKMAGSISPVTGENSEEIEKIETTTLMATIAPVITSKIETETESAITENEETPENEKGSMITSILEEAKSLDTNKTSTVETPTTQEPETVNKYSINKHYQDSGEDKLMAVLENKPQSESNETSVEIEREPEEGMDITFDAINMLYNRSSKSIENQPKGNNNGIQETTENNEAVSDTTGTTVDTDWLSEPVSEINYSEAMNKMAKHETTEPTVNKIDDIMSHGLVKDDFEPDYLNNMGSNSNKQESDEPLYGMVHDYDNEDTRFKRVNKEITSKAVQKSLTEDAESAKNLNATNSETSANSNTSVETTTVSEYIYKLAEKSLNVPKLTMIMHQESEMNDSSLSTTSEPPSVINYEPALIMKAQTEEEPNMHAEPAPVWEESDADKYLTVKQLPKSVEENTETHNPVMIDEIKMPSTTITPTTTVITENSKSIIMNYTKNSDLSENSQNTTQLNNLNVTIYEISSHSGNNSVQLAKPANAQSAEYDDHETEMNPFLPEVENNKSLVKKLQEGHDLEPTNLTETQNENTEEHTISSTEGQTTSSKDSLAVLAKESEPKNQEQSLPVTTEDDTSFNDLLMNVNSGKNVTQEKLNDDSKLPKLKEKEALPISTFLLDTDDLVTRPPSTTITGNKLDGEIGNTETATPAIARDSEFLSVVPIEEEKEELFRQHKSDNIEELNDISDLPKSDKRTLDATKFDSVKNNEA